MDLTRCRCGEPFSSDAHVLNNSSGHTFACFECGSTHQKTIKEEWRGREYSQIVCEGCGANLAEVLP